MGILRIGTWNMGRRTDGWTSAEELCRQESLQVLLLQEATRPDSPPPGWRLHPGTSDWMTEGRRFTTAIACCDPTLEFTPLTSRRLGEPAGTNGALTASHPGTFAAASVGESPEESLVVVSAYGLLAEGSSHRALHRLISDLEPLLLGPQGTRTLIGGDLNSGDQPYDWSTPFHVPVWQRLTLLKLTNELAEFASGPLAGCSCELGSNCRHVRTQRFRGSSTNAWQADYVLTMPGVRATECRALNQSPDEDWPSDHCPVVAEVRF